MLPRGRKVLASPAQFQFSHARSSQCAWVPSRAQLGTRVSHAGRRQVTFVPSTEPTAPPQTQRSLGSGPGRIEGPGWGGSRGQGHPAATPTGDAVTGAPALRAPQPTSARPRAHHLSGRRARAPGSRRPARLLRIPGPGRPESAADESFTGGWALRRRCRCSRSPAGSARAPGPCPEPRRPPPSWLAAEAPAGRGAARTTGASGRWRKRGAALRGGVCGRGRGLRGRGAEGGVRPPAGR